MGGRTHQSEDTFSFWETILSAPDFLEIPFLPSAAAVTPTRCGVSDEKPDFKISGDVVWDGEMRTAMSPGVNEKEVMGHRLK
jgi:hypothetical protein